MPPRKRQESEKERMKSEDIQQLKELVAFLKENDIAEFDLDHGDMKVSLKFASAVVQPAAPAPSALDFAALARLAGSAAPAAIPAVHAAAAPAAPAAPAPAAAEEEALHVIKSPIVGTFYESPSPGSPAFVSNGDRIDKGQVVCIVEAMKLMNEIEADAAGEIVKRFVTNGQPVEYGQPLFAIRTA
jgi:acetyl-CoA carboxylase biotin carboxyl carrier protein